MLWIIKYSSLCQTDYKIYPIPNFSHTWTGWLSLCTSYRFPSLRPVTFSALVFCRFESCLECWFILRNRFCWTYRIQWNGPSPVSPSTACSSQILCPLEKLIGSGGSYLGLEKMWKQFFIIFCQKNPRLWHRSKQQYLQGQ